MSDASDNPQRLPLNVINPNDKVEQLRREAAAAPIKPAADATVVDRFLDASKSAKQKAITEKVIEAIRQVYDPEIPVNIYDLGLIYDIDVNEQSGAVRVKMTLTAPACPVAGELLAAVESRVENIPEVPEATVELVFDPPWDRSMMSEAAQLELGLL